MRIANDHKLFLTLLLLVILTFTLTSLAFAEAAAVKIQTPPVAAALPLLWMQETGQLEDIVDLDIKLSSDHKRAIALISKNQIDMMATGVSVGAKIYNQGVGVKLLNVNTWAVDYLLTNNEKINDWEELKGKTLSLPLRGGPLDFLLRYLLKKNEIDPDSLNLVYRPLPNGARYFMTGKIDAIVLPEPLVTVNLVKNKKAHLSFNIQKEWARFHKGEERIPFVGLFVSNKFAENNPMYTDLINGTYKKGVDWVNNNPDEAASLAAEHFDMPAKIIRASLKRVNLNTYPAGERNALLETYFTETMSIYPEMLGGKIPDEDFYYK